MDSFFNYVSKTINISRRVSEIFKSLKIKFPANYLVLLFYKQKLSLRKARKIGCFRI